MSETRLVVAEDLDEVLQQITRSGERLVGQPSRQSDGRYLVVTAKQAPRRETR